jgi:hypothetical protein
MYFSIKPGPTGFTPEYTPYGNRTITHSCNPPWTIRVMRDWTTRDMFTGLIVRVSSWHLPADICQPILVIREDASGYVKTRRTGERMRVSAVLYIIPACKGVLQRTTRKTWRPSCLLSGRNSQGQKQDVINFLSTTAHDARTEYKNRTQEQNTRTQDIVYGIGRSAPPTE